MATIYLRSTDGDDADDGSTWALAKATLAAALTAAGAGGTVYVSQAHAENSTSATITLTSAGTPAAPQRVLCVNDNGTPGALTTGAVVSTTGAYAVVFGSGYCYVRGVSFVAGLANNSSNAVINLNTAGSAWNLSECKLAIASTSTSCRMNIGTSGTTHNDNGLYLLNTTVKFGHVSQGIVIRSFLSWEATANAIDSAGTIPTAGLFRPVVTGEGTCHCIGVDFANMGSNPLVDIVVACNAKYVFEDCKIASGTTFTNGDGTLDDVFSRSGTTVTATNCDDSDNFRYYKKSFRGEIASETTIVRTSPANATDGTTPCSRKMIGIGACFEDPLKSDWMEFWNETTGSAVTPLIAITSDAHLTQGQCWLEVECLSSSGCPLGVFSSSVEGDIITPGTTALTTDGDSTWASGKAHNYTISKAVTPTVKGLIRCRVCLATTDTLYFDPLPLAGARQFQSKDRHIQYPAATGGGGTRAWASIG